MLRGIRTLVVCIVWIAAWCVPEAGAVVFDRTDAVFTRCLDGDWRFKLVNAQSERGLVDAFVRPDFDDSGWSAISVPSNWEMKGFEDARYFRPDPAKYGLYRLKYEIPAEWRGRSLWLHFDGVLFAYTVYVNGTEAGSFSHAFLPAQFDITPFVGADSRTAVIAVKVVRDLRESQFDTNDCWALSGIYRDVYLFSPPEYHIDGYALHTRLNPAKTAATLEGHVDIRFFRSRRDEMGGERTPVKPLSLHVTLAEPGGRVVHDAVVPVNQRHPLILPSPEFRITVPKPKLWNAEEPNLYALTMTLTAGGETMQTVRTRVGLRTVSIEDGVFKVNGRPVKLRGVCRHEIHPEVGRALRDKHWREDIRLMKAANINAVRTSHYPPHERFLELCDEAGLYVIDEVPMGFGDRYLNVPDMRGTMLARAEETVARDRNHPSVVVWSIGNENPLTVNLEKTAREVKLLDPERPVLYPGGNFNGAPNDRTNTGHSYFVDILSRHYPTNDEMDQYARERTYRIPWIFTEINHALHAGFDDWRAKWELIEKTDVFAGGMIWLWADQGIRRTVNGRPVYSSYPGPFPQGIDTDAALSEDWRVDANTIIDAHGEFGMDGIVNPDRSPQTDYYETRKVYSPVIILEDSIATSAGVRTAAVTLENRYDFTNLSTVKCVRSYLVNGAVRESVPVTLACPPCSSVKLAFPVPGPSGQVTDDRAMRFEFTDRYGVKIYERTVRLVSGGKFAARMKRAEGETSEAAASSDGSGWQAGGVTVALLPDSTLTVKTADGREVARGPYVRVGRAPTIGERRTYDNLKLAYWQPPVQTKPAGVTVTESRDGGNLVLTVRAEYALPGDHKRTVSSSTVLTVRLGGIIDIASELTPAGDGALMEFGPAWVFPGAEAVSWLGGGPYPAYPYKDTLNEHGVWRMSSGDPFFTGNRRNVEMVRIGGAADGVGILTAPSDIGWERVPGGGIVMSMNIRVAGLGTKFHPPRQMWRTGDIGTVRGTMRWALPGKSGTALFQEMFGN